MRKLYTKNFALFFVTCCISSWYFKPQTLNIKYHIKLKFNRYKFTEKRKHKTRSKICVSCHFKVISCTVRITDESLYYVPSEATFNNEILVEPEIQIFRRIQNFQNFIMFKHFDRSFRKFNTKYCTVWDCNIFQSDIKFKRDACAFIQNLLFLVIKKTPKIP